jgi:hypothetical protein
MLPRQINGLVGKFGIKMVDRIPNKRAEINFEQGYISIVKKHPTGEITSLMHEMVHLAFSLAAGCVGAETDDREEPACAFLGRFLPKVIADNPTMLQKMPAVVDVLGEIWTVLECEYPDDHDDDVAFTADVRTQTYRIGQSMSNDNKIMRVFMLTCASILEACMVSGGTDGYYLSMFAMLFALLRANPEVITSCGEI